MILPQAGLNYLWRFFPALLLYDSSLQLVQDQDSKKIILDPFFPLIFSLTALRITSAQLRTEPPVFKTDTLSIILLL